MLPEPVTQKESSGPRCQRHTEGQPKGCGEPMQWFSHPHYAEGYWRCVNDACFWSH